MTYIMLQNIHHVATPKAPKTLFKSPPFALMTTVLKCALLIALRSLNFLMLRYKEKRWDFKRMLDSGGMPWSLFATLSTVTIAIGLQEGYG
ncbi:hypothetical protein AB3S75_013369 [Citrus x aurantiifolia]